MTVAKTSLKQTVLPTNLSGFSRADFARTNLTKNDSIWTNYLNGNTYNSSTSSATKSLNILSMAMGLFGLVGIGASFYKLFAKPAEQNKNADAKTAPTETNALDTAMKTADKTGDWAPVKTQYENAVAEHAVNAQKSAACDTSIQNSKDKINGGNGQKGLKNEIADKKSENQKYEQDIKTLDGQIAEQEKIVNDPNATAIQKDTAKKAIDNAKKEIEQTKDKIKANKTAIDEKQNEIAKETENIKTQTELKGQIDKANAQLQKTIDDAKAKLDLHLGATTDTLNNSNQSTSAKASTPVSTKKNYTSIDDIKSATGDNTVDLKKKYGQFLSFSSNGDF